MKVYCKNCKWFFGTDASVEVDFIWGFTKTSLPIKVPSNILESEFLIPMCQRRECFKFKENKPNPERPIAKFKKIRVKGQGQFNINNNCKHYIRKWWKFWIKQPRIRGKVKLRQSWPCCPNKPTSSPLPHKEDLQKSYIHKRPKPDTKSPTKRPSKQNKRKKK